MKKSHQNPEEKEKEGGRSQSWRKLQSWRGWAEARRGEARRPSCRRQVFRTITRHLELCLPVTRSSRKRRGERERDTQWEEERRDSEMRRGNTVWNEGGRKEEEKRKRFNSTQTKLSTRLPAQTQSFSISRNKPPHDGHDSWIKLSDIYHLS